MIQYLQRMRNKKGFTFVELIVVMGIIAVLAAIIIPNLIGNDTDKKRSANVNSQTFFTAVQLAMTRAQTTERSLVSYATGEFHFIEYEKGVNTIKSQLGESAPLMFIEAEFEQRGIKGVHIEETLTRLMALPDFDGTTQTTLESYIATNLDKYMVDSYQGYFYAVVDSNFTVLATHFVQDRLPMSTSYANASAFRDALMLNSSERVTGYDCILGSCWEGNVFPTTGDYVFNAPGSTDPDFDLYFAA